MRQSIQTGKVRVISSEQSQSLAPRKRLSPKSMVRKTTRDRLFRIHSLFIWIATALATTSLDFELDVQVVDNECKEAKPHGPKEYTQNGETYLNCFAFSMSTDAAAILNFLSSIS